MSAVFDLGASPPQAAPGGRQPVLRLDAVTKRYGSVVALDDVSITFWPGEVHAIVGENGAGKSTLINVASGVVVANAGTLLIEERPIERASPSVMRQHGVAVVHQHPALVPDLTVRENIALAGGGGLPGRGEVFSLLEKVASGGMGIDPDDRLASLKIAQWHVVEIAKALRRTPRLLILDEPTEPFGRNEVKRLFALIDDLRRNGTAIVYISHRVSEVLEIADTISVLRDGRHIGTAPRQTMTEADIVAKIAGRPMDRLFPEKTARPGVCRLEVKRLSGDGFSDMSVTLRAGEIVGLAGIEGQGQRPFLRALAGLEKVTSGEILCDGERVTLGDRAGALAYGIGFVTDNRHSEGLFPGTPLFENLSAPFLDSLAVGGFIATRREMDSARAAMSRFSIKAAGIHAVPEHLSGGNQQKVLFAREFGAQPKVLVIDEPTKGVDVGSRYEIYTALRRMSGEGAAIITLCSDALELQGLCDVVHVISNGRIAKTLVGDDVVEAKIAAAMVAGAGEKSDALGAGRSTAWRRFLSGDLFPILPVGLVALAIMAAAAIVNPYYLTGMNLANLGGLFAVLAFVALGQACVFAIGGIGLSPGPLCGLVVVLASYFMPNGGGGGGIVLAIGLILLVCLGVGLVHATLIAMLRLAPIVVTLATFVAIGGVSLMLRPEPAGTISYDFIDLTETEWFGIPAGVGLVVAAAIGLAAISRFTTLGRQMRSWGSNSRTAERLGVSEAAMLFVAYPVSALLSGCASLLLAAKIGIGSAAVGAEYTLMGVTAFVISGAAVTGGRLSFAAILVAAALVQVTLNVTAFLNLDSAWQYWLAGGAAIAGAVVFSQLRRATRSH